MSDFCIMVELARGRYVINNATLSSFLSKYVLNMSNKTRWGKHNKVFSSKRRILQIPLAQENEIMFLTVDNAAILSSTTKLA